MQFKVSGVNRESGARMALQFDTTSKAAAERKASQSGMDVHRCVADTDETGANDVGLLAGPRTETRYEMGRADRGTMKWAIVTVVILAATAAAYLALPHLRSMLRL